MENISLIDIINHLVDFNRDDLIKLMIAIKEVLDYYEKEEKRLNE